MPYLSKRPALSTAGSGAAPGKGPGVSFSLGEAGRPWASVSAAVNSKLLAGQANGWAMTAELIQLYIAINPRWISIYY